MDAGADSATGGDEESRYEAMRDRYWEVAGIEGVSLEAFVESALSDDRSEATLRRLRRLVDEVEETALLNIAVKAEEEGGMYEALADERIEEVREEHARLAARLERAADGGR